MKTVKTENTLRSGEEPNAEFHGRLQLLGKNNSRWLSGLTSFKRYDLAQKKLGTSWKRCVGPPSQALKT